MQYECEIRKLNDTILKDKIFKISHIHGDGKPTIRNTCSMQCDIHGNSENWSNPWFPTIRSLKQGKGCPKCSQRYQYTEDDILEEFNNTILVDKTVKIKSIIDYQNTKSRCVMTCSIHGDSDQWDKSWTPRISDLKDGCGCPKCGHELKDVYKILNQDTTEGFYTKTKFYFINFERKNKKFTKLGITQQEINQRFKTCNLNRANINIISEEVKELDTIFALILEFYLLNKFSSFKEYQPSLKKYHIGGATECFTVELNNILNLDEEINYLKNNFNTVIQSLIDNKIIPKNKTKILLNLSF